MMIHAYLVPALGGRGRGAVSEFEASLIYIRVPDLPGLHRETLVSE